MTKSESWNQDNYPCCCPIKTDLYTCLNASTMTGAKSWVNSGPFLLLFWMTSLAKYRKVSLRDTWAAHVWINKETHIISNYDLQKRYNTTMPINWQVHFNHWRTKNESIKIMRYKKWNRADLNLQQKRLKVTDTEF